MKEMEYATDSLGKRYKLKENGKMHKGASEGNDFNKKLKTTEIKKIVYNDYCNHIAKGYSHKSWRYDKNGVNLCWESIEKYIKNDQDLDPLHKKIAIAESLKVWEDLGKEMMMGRVEKCQPAIYQMFMRNKFGWDKQQKLVDEEKGPENYDAEYPNEK
jgi:hypothetical protein